MKKSTILDVSITYDLVQASHPYATHAYLVEVDPGSGAVVIRRYVIAEDCSTMINPMIVDGQVAGGVAQGVGTALLEEISYGADGQMLSGSFRTISLPPTRCRLWRDQAPCHAIHGARARHKGRR
jgi:carbon-monoxide dehydrogenase large subunit